jgi:hypothetical protein
MASSRRLIQHHQQEERKVINAGSRRRFWSLVGAIGFVDVVGVALVSIRTAGR